MNTNLNHWFLLFFSKYESANGLLLFVKTTKLVKIGLLSFVLNIRLVYQIAWFLNINYFQKCLIIWLNGLHGNVVLQVEPTK